MSEKYFVPSTETSEEKYLFKISNSVVQKLISGVPNEERLTSYESFWADKLAVVDADHSKKKGLDINEAEKILNDINAYINTKSQRHCPSVALKMVDCLQNNIGNTLTCEPEVQKFKNCVDKSLRDAVRKNVNDVLKNKK